MALAQRKTMPKPLYTEATLLAAMETCGRNITDEKAREAMKELGIGTPATRAAIITTLFKRDYIERSGKSTCTYREGTLHLRGGKGHAGGRRGADRQLGENTPTDRAAYSGPDTLLYALHREYYTRKVTREVLGLKFPAPQTAYHSCPKCRYRQSDDTPEGRQVRQS